MTTTRKPAEIQSACIYRVTCKATKEIYYIVKSDSDQGLWYEVRFDHSLVAWTCPCKATKPCKHIAAVREILKIRRARVAAAIGGDMPQIIAQLQREEESREEVALATIAQAQAVLDEASRRRHEAPLNGNQGFSLLKR